MASTVYESEICGGELAPPPPPLEVIKFTGDPCEFFKFKSRFHQVVESQNLSDSQKMSRLLQFLEGNARKTIAGFEGTPGGVRKAMRLLEL